jgi:hypothetical protein
MEVTDLWPPWLTRSYHPRHEHIEYVRPHMAENGGPIIMTQAR